ncbi:MAG: hypothetical protein RI933_519, partial [Actinomycetota bacterium]
MKQINQLHKPVLLERCIELLGPALKKPGAVLVDGTLGLAGHSEAFLHAFPELVLVGIDRDPKALELAAERLKTFADRIHLVHAVYDEIEDVLDELDIEYADAILLDLGVSSMQLDEGERGFAYSYDAPLDMRMDNTTGMTAADVLNTYNENDLVRIFREYGEEKFAKPIARQIVATRHSQPFETSAQLSG